MTEEQLEEQVDNNTDSEEVVNDTQETEEDTQDQDQSTEKDATEQTVPLTALTAERKKRQETENQVRLLAEYVNKLKSAEQDQQPEEEDPEDWVTNQRFKETQNQTKQEIMEEMYLQMNPDALPKINKYLTQIIEQKPWLADSVKTATNRYARAYEIVNDYGHMVEPKRNSQAQADAARVVQNANKPKSPVATGKSAKMSNTEYLKSIAGTKEFREYRNKVRQGKL
jgi:hypothetical protein